VAPASAPRVFLSITRIQPDSPGLSTAPLPQLAVSPHPAASTSRITLSPQIIGFPFKFPDLYHSD
jgi:hypothetical protein